MTMGHNHCPRGRVFAAASILALGLALSAPNHGYADTLAFDIPAQPLSDALAEFSRQSNVNVLAPSSLTRGKTSKPVTGDMEPTQALDALLGNSTIKYETQADGSVLLTLSSADQVIAPVRVAQANNANTTDDVGPRNETEISDGDVPQRDEMVVTGTRIRGVEPAAPSITFGRTEIDKAGFNTVEDLFQSLPQNLGEISRSGTFGNGTSRIAASNAESTNGVSLRGLGPESTLVLVNGRRYPGAINGRVVDISAIPLSAIERVDVVTGGNSALYGSDAVAGVVNLVTRRDFDGVETQAYYGFAEDGAERFQSNLVFGIDGDRGGFIAAYDYARDWVLDATEAGIVGPSPFGVVPIPGRFTLQPDRWRHSLFFSGHYDLSDRIELYGEALYTFDKTKSLSENNFSIQNITAQSDLYVGTAGANVELATDWSLNVAGTYGVRDAGSRAATSIGPSSSESRSEIIHVTAAFEGTAFTLGEIDILTAFGGEVRKESFKEKSSFDPTPFADVDRTIGSVFGEINLPFVQDGTMPGLRRVELTLAGRYDHYSDFGDTFDPQIGAIWSPFDDLTFRGTFATAFRAPALFTQALAETNTNAFLQPLFDPQSPFLFSPTLILFGSTPNLQPEEAETFTVGFDYEPSFAGNTRLSVSYFDIDYENRITEPAAGNDRFTVLQNEDIYASLITRNPTEAEARAFFDRVQRASLGSFANVTGVPFDPLTQNFLDVFPDLVLFDNQRANIGIESVRGLDFQITSTLPTDFGDLSFGFNGVYYLEFERALTANASFVTQLNEPGKLIDFQFRANAGWQRGPWGASAFVNYTDSYTDTLAMPNVEISSWTTVDLVLRFDGSQFESLPLLNGFSATLSVDNLLDEEPPFFGNNTFGLAFDTANADARGRFIAFRLVNRW